MQSPIPTLTFANIRARGVDVPLKTPAVTAAGTFSSWPVVLIDLETVQGVRGVSYIFAYERFAVKPLVALVESLGELVRGHLLRPLAVEAFLQRRLRMLGPQGLVGMALGGFDMAVWDAVSRAAGMPLAVFLGAELRPIAAYCTLKTMTPSGAARDAVEAVKKGFSGVKVKVGGASVADDVAVVDAIRREVGPGVAIMVDYNQVLSVPEAVTRGRILDDYNLAWIEEPTRAHDFDGHAEIARQVRTPISIGENWNGLPDAAKSILSRASDLIMPDATKIGGVTGWLRTAALAEAQGIPLSGHALPELSLHLLAATATAHWLEYADIIETIVQEPIQLRNGCALIPDKPGFGLEWDEKALRSVSA